MPKTPRIEPIKRRLDPVFVHSRLEAIVIAFLWTACTAYSCLYSYFLGYLRPGRDLGPSDVQPIMGVPSWFFWGVMAPWVVCGIANVLFSALFVKEDDLGLDHTIHLEHEIREGSAGFEGDAR